jgi:hypothetical protein
MSSYFAAFSYVPPMRWGSPKLWAAFDAYLDARMEQQLKMFTKMSAMPAEEVPVITASMFVAAIEAMEYRERQLPPWFN